MIELRERSRISEDLQQERNRLVNRLREQLWRYYPQMLAFGGGVAGIYSPGRKFRHEQNLDEHVGSQIIKVNQRKLDAMTAAFTVRVKDETASKLDQLAAKLDRSRSYMAAEAIEAFVEQQEWQLAEIEAGLAEADRGEFASDADVAKVVGKYIKSVRQS